MISYKCSRKAEIKGNDNTSFICCRSVCTASCREEGEELLPVSWSCFTDAIVRHPKICCHQLTGPNILYVGPSVHRQRSLAAKQNLPGLINGHKKLQFFEWPPEAGSKSESISIHPHVKIPNFTAEINLFTAWYKLYGGQSITLSGRLG